MKRRIVAPMVIGGVLLAGVASVAATGAAYAQTPNASTAAASATAGTTHPIQQWVRSHRRAIERGVVTVSAKTIGITPQDLVSDLRSGKSIAQVATDNSVNPQNVVSALVNGAEAKVSEAVANQRITSAQASKIDAALPGRVTKIVNHVF